MGSRHASLILLVTFVFMFSGCRGRDHAKGEKNDIQKPDASQASVDIASAMEGAKLLDEALDARLGIDSITAAQQWTARSSGTYMGMPYSGITTFNGQSMRMDIKVAGGREMSFVMGGENCWSRTGPVVTSCSDVERKAYKEQFVWENAARLYPLKQEGWVYHRDTTKVADKDYPTLVISRRDVQGEGKLVFDPKSKLLVKSILPMVFNGKNGVMESDMLDYRNECGTMMPFHVISLFDGKKVMEDKVEEYFCGPVERDLFPEPLQVADGTFSQYTTGAITAYCTTVYAKGSYPGPAVGKLMRSIAEKRLPQAGPLFSLYIAPAAKAGKEQQQEMELCVPVSVPAPEKPQVSGKYVLKEFPPTRVLSVFGLGDYDDQFDRLSKLLEKEIKVRKLKKNGHMIHVFHHDPSTIAKSRLVSELKVPIE